MLSLPQTCSIPRPSVTSLGTPLMVLADQLCCAVIPMGNSGLMPPVAQNVAIDIIKSSTVAGM